MVSKLEATLDSKLERVALEPDAVLNPSGLECLVIVARQHGLHLTAPQLIQDNLLGGDEVSSSDLIKCAAKAGLSAKAVSLDWKGLQHLKKALPAIVKLKNGASMVLLRVDGDDEDNFRVVLQDPNAGDDALLGDRPTAF